MNSEDSQMIRQRQAQEKAQQEKLQKEKSLRDTHKKIKKNIKKRNQASFWKRYEDHFGYALLAVIVGFLLYANFSGDRRKPSQIPVNEDTLITSINDEGGTFKAKVQNYFDTDSLKEIQQMTNVKFTSQKNQQDCDLKNLEDVVAPESYNFYETNPNCQFDQEMRKCSSSYVEGPASMFRNRYCLQKLGDDFKPAIDYNFQCDTQLNKGCKTGYLLDALQFVQDNGFVDEKCWSKLDNQETCPKESEIEQCKKYQISGYCVLEGESNIKKEVFKNGPILGFMTPFRELLVYESGIFRFLGREPLQGYTVVKIVGWGRDEESELDFWLIDPMWGNDFGDKGLFKVERGTGELFLDKWGVTFNLNQQIIL